MTGCPRFLRVLPAVLLIAGAAVSLAPVSPVLAATVSDCPTTESALQTDISNAGNGGTVQFACSSPTTIYFSSTITINQSVTLDAGTSAGSVTFDGSNSGNPVQLFVVNSPASFTLNALTLQNASASCTIRVSGNCSGSGGAIQINSGTLTITNSTFSGNSSSCTAAGGDSNCSGAGGAIDNGNGSVTITNSTFSSNSSSCNSAGSDYACHVFGGGISNGGGSLTITNSTFSGNSVTCTGRCGVYGGAIYLASGTVTIGGTILANSTGGNCYNNGGTITDWGYNLEDMADSCGFSTANHDLIATSPGPLALANNGGPTETMALQTSPTVSPAIDYIPTTAANNLCPATGGTDQRGYPRPDEDAAGFETVCDIGAYEHQDLAATGLSAQPASGVYGGTTTLSATLTDQNGIGIQGKTIVFSLNGRQVCGGTTGATCPTTNASGIATLSNVSLGTIAAGTYTPCSSTTGVYASFAGDTTYGPGSGCNTLTVNQAATTTTLTSSQNPSTTGQSVTFTAAITVNPPGSGTPTGTVAFQDNGSDIQDCGSQTVSTSNNTTTATCQTGTLSPGVHTITAIYSGDHNFIGSTGSLQQGVSTTVPNGTTAYDIESSNWSCGGGGTTCIPLTDTDASQCVTMTPCPGASYGDVEAFGPATDAAYGIPDELILACVQGTATGYQIGYLDVLSHQGNLDYPGGVYGNADSGVISGKGTLIGGGGAEDNPSQPSSVTASVYDASTGIIGSVSGIQNTDNGSNTLNSGQFRVTIRGRLWTVNLMGTSPVFTQNATSSTMSCTVGGSHANDLRNAGLDTVSLAEGELEPSLGDNFFLQSVARHS